MELLRHGIEDLGLKGVKCGPIYKGVPLDDPAHDADLRLLCAGTTRRSPCMGTTFGRNTPLELGRAIHDDSIARCWPDLKMVLAQMGHPWYEECIVVVRKHLNVYAEMSALFYRQHLRPPYRSLRAGRENPTEQIACYENWSYRVLPKR